MKSWLPVILFLGALSGCGESIRDREDYGDVLASPGGLQLVTSSEHPSGWGRSECLLCHNVSLNIHRRPGSGVDADAIAEAAKNNGGSAYCLICHGPNGL